MNLFLKMLTLRVKNPKNLKENENLYVTGLLQLNSSLPLYKKKKDLKIYLSQKWL